MTVLPDFEYRRPENLTGVLSALEEGGGKALLLAGGTDLIPRMKLGLKKPELVIDIKNLEDLRTIAVEKGNLKIGALTAIYEVARHSIIKENFPTLHDAAAATASEIIQFRGTIGGNILQETRCTHYNKSAIWRQSFPPCLKTGGEMCNVIKGARTCRSVYCGDLAPAFLSLDASVVIVSTHEERELPLKDIFTGDGVKPFSLKGTEFLREIRIPFRKTRGRYKKFRLRDAVDYPILSVALSVDGTGCGNLVLGSCGPRPLKYKLSSPEDMNDIPLKVFGDMRPIDNMILPPRYRKRLARIFAKRIIEEFFL